MKLKSYRFWMLLSIALIAVLSASVYVFGWLFPIKPTYLPTDDMLIREHGKYVWKGYYANGQLKFRSEWKKGNQGRFIQDGKEEEWWSNGKKKLLSEWRDGARDGVYKTWNTDGSEVVDGEFKDGKPVR